MNSDTTETQSGDTASTAPPPLSLTWRVFPMKDSPAKGVLFWLVVAFTLWAVYWNLQSLLLTGVAAGMLLGSLSSFFLPTRYWLKPEGAGFNRWIFNRRIEWNRVRSVSSENRGIFLSPYPLKTRLENFRGMYLPFNGNNDSVREIVRQFAPDARWLGSSLNKSVEVKA